MTELKFYLLFFMIAAPQGALGSAAEEFVEVWMDWYAFASSMITEDYYGRTNNSDECFSAAVTEDAQAVRIEDGYCFLDFLRSPVCAKREGDRHYYVRKEFLSNGSPNDNATYDVNGYKHVVPAGTVIRFFRIESPTIFKFADLLDDIVPLEKKLQYFATRAAGYSFGYSEHPVFMDPSCYTTSACSDVFLTTAPEVPESEILILYDICGQSIQVDSGKSFYILSHESIGCKNFPNDYPVADCSAEFTGAGEITTNVTLVNFRESDQCDGFTMTAVTDDANGSSTSTDLCDAASPTELTSAGGKVKIEFGDSASPTREKYGFNIQVTAA